MLELARVCKQRIENLYTEVVRYETTSNTGLYLDLAEAFSIDEKYRVLSNERKSLEAFILRIDSDVTKIVSVMDTIRSFKHSSDIWSKEIETMLDNIEYTRLGMKRLVFTLTIRLQVKYNGLYEDELKEAVTEAEDVLKFNFSTESVDIINRKLSNIKDRMESNKRHMRTILDDRSKVEEALGLIPETFDF